MCMYCEENEILKSANFCGSAKAQIIGYYLDIYGDEKKFNIFKRIYRPSFKINYCPICRKEVGRVIENYREIKFTEYVKHKGEPDWEIAWNKRMLELIDKDPTGGAKEKRLKNIRRWEEVKEKNAKRSD